MPTLRPATSDILKAVSPRKFPCDRLPQFKAENPTSVEDKVKGVCSSFLFNYKYKTSQSQISYKSMKSYYWKVEVKIGDRVSTDDGFTGKITSGQNGVWRVKYDASERILKLFKKKSYGHYKLKELNLI